MSDNNTIRKTAVSYRQITAGTEIPERATIHGFEVLADGIMLEWSVED